MSVADLDWRLRRMGDQLVLAAGDPVTEPQEPTEPELPPETIDEKLRGLY
jgi:hypothetical protein